MSDPKQQQLQQMLELARQNFLDASLQKLDELDGLLVSFTAGQERGADLEILVRHVHSLKGAGRTFGMALISKLSHELEQYMKEHTSREPGYWEAVQVYLDVMRDVFEARELLDAQAEQRYEMKLAEKLKLQLTPQPLQLKVLVVSPTRVVREMVTYILTQQQCSTTATESPFDAFRLAVTGVPDLVITSIKMKYLNGHELLQALHAVPATRGCSVALLSGTEGEAHPELSTLGEIPVLSTATLEQTLPELLSTIRGERDGG